MKAFRDLFRRTGAAALRYAAVFSAVIIIWQLILKALSVTEESTIGEGAFLLISEVSFRIYMLVTGIVCPLVYLSHYIAAGVTRKQFAAGIFASAALISLCLAVLRIPLLIAYGEFSMLAVLVSALYGALSFLMGWTASVGFQYMRAIPIMAGVVCTTALFNGLIWLDRLRLPLCSYFPIFTCAIVVVGAGLLKAAALIPVKS